MAIYRTRRGAFYFGIESAYGVGVLSYTVSGAADNGAGLARLATSAPHLCVAGEWIRVTGTTDYNGMHKVVTANDGTHVDINVAYTSSQTGLLYGPYWYMPVEEMSWDDMGYGYQEGEDIQQEDTEDIGRPIAQPGKFSFRAGLHPFQSAMPAAAVTALPHPPMRLLGCVLGGLDKGGYVADVVDSGSTETVIQVAEGASTTGDIDVGQPIFMTDASARNMVGVVKAIALSGGNPDEITIRGKLPAVPADASKVCGGHWAYKTTQTQSIEAIWRGEAATDYRRALGCKPSKCVIAAAPRSFATLSMDLDFGSCDALLTTEDRGAPDTEAYAYPEKAQVMNGGLYVYEGSTLTKVTGGIEIDLGLTVSPDDGINATDPNGVSDIAVIGRQIRIKCTPSWGNNYYADAFRDSTTFDLIAWWGTAGTCWMFSAPAAFQVQHPKEADRNGIRAQELIFGVKAYTGDTGTDPAADAPFVCGCIAG